MIPALNHLALANDSEGQARKDAGGASARSEMKSRHQHAHTPLSVLIHSPWKPVCYFSDEAVENHCTLTSPLELASGSEGYILILFENGVHLSVAAACVRGMIKSVIPGGNAEAVPSRV